MRELLTCTRQEFVIPSVPCSASWRWSSLEDWKHFGTFHLPIPTPIPAPIDFYRKV
ncbi:hypothetical protein RirG_121480 [Rhizophagus irregularis DAOM 197198w]|uniref:Uncharacterized protein n=1 Tax=Rhizophagus irregularis (strain DAOM 197198w) TaxID=1432141 RepID=A0A015JB06_RHIIW|nr:hypothetical protein RirG_121480 [Rhizophagus irregularis DAOM 197198w]